MTPHHLTKASKPNVCLHVLSPYSWVRHVPRWLGDTSGLLDQLTAELAWTQETLKMFGKEVYQPRLTAVCGRSMSPASRYRLPNPDRPWTPLTRAVLHAVNSEVPDLVGNGLIANLYRDGNDSISWHADDEPALGQDPVV